MNKIIHLNLGDSEDFITLEFSSVSEAMNVAKSVLMSGNHILGVKGSQESDVNAMKDYISWIQNSINLRR